MEQELRVTACTYTTILRVRCGICSGLSWRTPSFSSEDLSALLESPNTRPCRSDSEDLEEMERLRKEHIEALREIKRLQEQLGESHRVHHQTEEELSKVKQNLTFSQNLKFLLRILHKVAPPLPLSEY
ncbi:hypothetical protein F7725_013654 [Dissostichus mawsoni]|uniref:Uncharacterized protein n=1 Tax=Dissostichus mawsoni TaxID=36200 RepID=A0A7J5YU05_DISMA|nr:hypothetical protein F7725_013654 [Dissostichus mawsoni]